MLRVRSLGEVSIIHAPLQCSSNTYMCAHSMHCFMGRKRMLRGEVKTALWLGAEETFELGSVRGRRA